MNCKNFLRHGTHCEYSGIKLRMDHACVMRCMGRHLLHRRAYRQGGDAVKELRMQHDLRKCVQKYLDSGFELIRGERLLLVRGTRRYEIHNGIVREAA